MPRIMVYNIAYGTGCPNSLYSHLATAHRYLRVPERALEDIVRYVDSIAPDLLGLIEIDTGSYRTKYLNQVEYVARHLKRYHCSSVKYDTNGLGRLIPILRKQANAILTKKKFSEKHYHFFPTGFKKLIIEVDFEGVRFFLIHLAINKRVRKNQLRHLSELVKGRRPVIVAGDFNTFSGIKEIHSFKREAELVNPNTKNLPTYPSWRATRQLDFILCSKEIEINDFTVPDVKYSDHKPLLLDYSI